MFYKVVVFTMLVLLFPAFPCPAPVIRNSGKKTLHLQLSGKKFTLAPGQSAHISRAETKSAQVQRLLKKGLLVLRKSRHDGQKELSQRLVMVRLYARAPVENAVLFVDGQRKGILSRGDGTLISLAAGRTYRLEGRAMIRVPVKKGKAYRVKAGKLLFKKQYSVPKTGSQMLVVVLGGKQNK